MSRPTSQTTARVAWASFSRFDAMTRDAGRASTSHAAGEGARKRGSAKKVLLLLFSKRLRFRNHVLAQTDAKLDGGAASKPSVSGGTMPLLLKLLLLLLTLLLLLFWPAASRGDQNGSLCALVDCSAPSALWLDANSEASAGGAERTPVLTDREQQRASVRLRGVLDVLTGALPTELGQMADSLHWHSVCCGSVAAAAAAVTDGNQVLISSPPPLSSSSPLDPSPLRSPLQSEPLRPLTPPRDLSDSSLASTISATDLAAAITDFNAAITDLAAAASPFAAADSWPLRLETTDRFQLARTGAWSACAVLAAGAYSGVTACEAACIANSHCEAFGHRPADNWCQLWAGECRTWYAAPGHNVYVAAGRAAAAGLAAAADPAAAAAAAPARGEDPTHRQLDGLGSAASGGAYGSVSGNALEGPSAHISHVSCLLY